MIKNSIKNSMENKHCNFRESIEKLMQETKKNIYE